MQPYSFNLKNVRYFDKTTSFVHGDCSNSSITPNPSSLLRSIFLEILYDS